MTMTTAPNEITAGLEYLLRPLKFTGISSHNTAMMVSLALRFIPTLIDEMNSISAAQLARGANFNPRRPGGKIRTVSYLALPLTINIFRRCDELVDAMEARGYQQGHRTYLRELELTRMDYGLLTVIIAATIVILLMY
jgi:biotin transport system permease protein/energy-coupling factor transport system permease protein